MTCTHFQSHCVVEVSCRVLLEDLRRCPVFQRSTVVKRVPELFRKTYHTEHLPVLVPTLADSSALLRRQFGCTGTRTRAQVTSTSL